MICSVVKCGRMREHCDVPNDMAEEKREKGRPRFSSTGPSLLILLPLPPPFIVSRCQLHYETCTYDVSRALSLINQAYPFVSILTESKGLLQKSRGHVWRWVSCAIVLSFLQLSYLSRSFFLCCFSNEPVHRLFVDRRYIVSLFATSIHILLNAPMLLAQAMFLYRIHARPEIMFVHVV